VLATYDAQFRAGFDRKITEWATDFIGRAHKDGKPFYAYLPYTQVHIPPIPDPEYAGKTKRGSWADNRERPPEHEVPLALLQRALGATV
jgi:hypothetical protein